MEDTWQRVYVPWTDVLSNIKKVIIEPGVTSIGSYAFYWCENLTEIEIPDTVTCIGKNAINTNLDGAKIKTVDYIARGTCGDKLIWQLKWDGTMTISGTGQMDNWNYYSMPWKNYVLDIKKVIVQDGVTSIGSYAFDYLQSECENLTEVILPNTITDIGKSAFCGCPVLSKISIPDSVKNIEEYAFSGCSFTDIRIPEGVTVIKAETFSACSALSSVSLPSTLTSIKGSAFADCEKLKNLALNGAPDLRK